MIRDMLTIFSLAVLGAFIFIGVDAVIHSPVLVWR